MPPKIKVDPEAIIEAALDLIRKGGLESVNARALAMRLGCSTQPVFSHYETIEQVKRDAIRRAGEIYAAGFQQSLSSDRYPPYKAAGMHYIAFASEEPALFRLLFMRNREGEPLAEAWTGSEAVRLAGNSAELSEESAAGMHMEMWAFTHGIASMIATSYLKFDTETVSRMLTDVHDGLARVYAEKEQK